MHAKKRVLLLLPVESYRNQDFLDAAATLGVEVVAAADYCHQLAPQWGMSPIQSVAFDQPGQAIGQLIGALGRRIDAVLAVDDSGQELAALVRARLGLPGNPPEAIRATRDKHAFRHLLAAHGFNCPAFAVVQGEALDAACAAPLGFPAVVKARRLSASRGVVRVDSEEAYRRALRRVRDIQTSADRDAPALGVLVESFIPGREVALEGLIENGRLRVLALFDKPDPLDGPYFEETLYVTPSRLPRATQDAIAHEVERACRVAGLVCGPVHAEARVNDAGVWLIELAARSIGGLCSRVLRHALGMSLEELVLRDALGLALPAPEPLAADNAASGVMMIPIPRRGILRGVAGLDTARAVPGIDEATITAREGQRVAPPPEGASYLGFLFARGATPQAVEASLRKAHGRLAFDIQPDVALERERDSLTL